ncbi:MAG: YceI family protein [Proteobacteria bacterium]|nr:YceI family protein [Pseudomonadota bacterium]MCP4915873.1 YceI family protein [Pseudomonadota bacterium]
MLITLLTLPASAERYAFDNDDGAIGFQMVATLHEIEGAATNFQGELDVGKRATHTGKITVQSNALTTNLDIRDERMHGYVLGVGEYPTVTFDIAAIDGDVAGLDSKKGKGEVVLKGQVTIRTVTKDVEIPAKYAWDDAGNLSIDTSWDTAWTNWNLPDPSILMSTLYPELTVNASVTASKAP